MDSQINEIAGEIDDGSRGILGAFVGFLLTPVIIALWNGVLVVFILWAVRTYS